MKIRFAMICALGLACAASFAALPEPLAKFVTKISGAKTLKASYSVMQIGGTAEKYSVAFGKPDTLKYDTPKQTIVADGTNITFYQKDSKKYFTRKQTPAEFSKLFKDDFLKAWKPFFDAKSLDAFSAKQGADVSRRGLQLRTVKVMLDDTTGKSLTLFIDKKDDLAKQIILEPKAGKTDLQLILDVDSLAVTDASGDAIAFKPPQGSQEINESDLIAVRWVTSFSEAKQIAQDEGKMILIDFFATWCGPCKMLESEVFPTEEFKALSSKFVFCRIDVDDQKEVAAQFNIEAMPTTIITDAAGTEKGRFLGYLPPSQYLEQIKQIVGF